MTKRFSNIIILCGNTECTFNKPIEYRPDHIGMICTYPDPKIGKHNYSNCSEEAKKILPTSHFYEGNFCESFKDE